MYQSNRCKVHEHVPTKAVSCIQGRTCLPSIVSAFWKNKATSWPTSTVLNHLWNLPSEFQPPCAHNSYLLKCQPQSPRLHHSAFVVACPACSASPFSFCQLPLPNSNKTHWKSARIKKGNAVPSRERIHKHKNISHRSKRKIIDSKVQLIRGLLCCFAVNYPKV